MRQSTSNLARPSARSPVRPILRAEDAPRRTKFRRASIWMQSAGSVGVSVVSSRNPTPFNLPLLGAGSLKPITRERRRKGREAAAEAEAGALPSCATSARRELRRCPACHGQLPSPACTRVLEGCHSEGRRGRSLEHFSRRRYGHN